MTPCRLALVALLAALVLSPEATGDDGAPPVSLTRDLSKLPAGRYAIVQSYDSTQAVKTEGTGEEEKPEETSRTWNTFTYELTVPPAPAGAGAPRVATVKVRRVQIRVESDKAHVFDSEADPAACSPVLVRQFRHLAGCRARVDLAEFAAGAGFKGLDAAFETYLRENPGKERIAEPNRRNYGDARLDRLFCHGLTLLFGPDAGRARGRTRALRPGEEFTVNLSVDGLAHEATETEHKCRVKSAGDGLAVLTASWHVNGFAPPLTGEDGAIVVRGGDAKADIEVAFRLDCGLAVRFREEITRTDQAARLPVQRTWRTHSVEELRIEPVPEETPPAKGR